VSWPVAEAFSKNVLRGPQSSESLSPPSRGGRKAKYALKNVVPLTVARRSTSKGFAVDGGGFLLSEKTFELRVPLNAKPRSREVAENNTRYQLFGAASAWKDSKLKRKSFWDGDCGEASKDSFT